ncbi:putative GNAT family N-acetyltransferase [Xylaria arbuscula]|nr:putative GNAT family N-acetyltransferase [Xylaria arbuscula]
MSATPVKSQLQKQTWTKNQFLVSTDPALVPISKLLEVFDSDPSYQGNGLGTWLVGRVREVLESMPNVRRSLLFTADWERSVPFYQRFLGMTLIETRKGEALAIMEKKGKGHPAYGREGTGYD